MGRMRHKFLALACVSALFLPGCITFNVGDDMVFLPQAQKPDRPAFQQEANLIKRGYKLDHQSINSSVGKIAITRISKPENAGKPLIVICMGTSADRQHSGNYYLYKTRGHGDVLMFDYPGYNESEGQASAADIDAAIKALAGHMQTQNTGRKTVAWGHSLGGFGCSKLAERSGVISGLIIEASAQNIDDVIKARTPGILKLILKPRGNKVMRSYDNAHALRGFTGPVLVLGAGQDKILDVKLSRKLAAALKAQGNDVQYEEFEDAGHETLHRADNYASVLEDYFERFE